MKRSLLIAATLLVGLSSFAGDYNYREICRSDLRHIAKMCYRDQGAYNLRQAQQMDRFIQAEIVGCMNREMSQYGYRAGRDWGLSVGVAADCY